MKRLVIFLVLAVVIAGGISGRRGGDRHANR